MLDRKYTIETMIYRHTWTPKLFSFRTTRNASFSFQGGQFARLGIKRHDSFVWRPYSMVSARDDRYLEFYSILVPTGELTPILAALKVGEEIYIDKTAFGFLTLDRFPQGGDLWLLATSTGIAPFLSILHEAAVWERFDHVVLVFSVREMAELTYQDRLQALYQHELFGDAVCRKLRIVKTVTRQRTAGAYAERITTLLEQRTLEHDLNLPIVKTRSRVMICGNPQMVSETRKLLQSRGLTLSRLSQPGNFAVEQFWSI